MAMNVQTTAPFAFGTVAVTNTALAISSLFSASELARASRARITNDAQAIVFRYDGLATITLGVGHYIAANGSVILDGNISIRNLQFIRHGASNSTIYVTLEE